MGRDGLSTKTGPIGGDNHTALGASETNTIQSLLQMKDTYEFLYHVGDIGSVLRTPSRSRSKGIRADRADVLSFSLQLRRLLLEGERPRLLWHHGR